MSTTAAGRGRRGWGRVVGGAVAVLALTAVPALGITHLGSDLLTGWAGGEEQAALASAGPLTFDSPAANFNRFKAQQKEATTRVVLEQEASLQLNGWQYTAACSASRRGPAPTTTSRKSTAR